MLYLCAHTMYGGGDAKDFTISTGAKWIKYVDGFPTGDVAKLANSGINILGRINFNELEPQPINSVLRGLDPKIYADYVFNNRLLEAIRRNPDITYWETGNEPVLGTWIDEGAKTLDNMQWLSDYTIRMCENINAAGKKPVIGNFSVGTPDLPEHDRLVIWKKFLPAMKVAASMGGYLGLHEYFSDKSTYDTWLQHRYTWILPLVKECGIKILITEFGADYVFGETAWKVRYNGDIKKYLDRIFQYYKKVRENTDLVEALFLFTFGPDWPMHNVDGFDIGAKWKELLLSENQPIPGFPNFPTPTPTPVMVNLVNGDFEDAIDGKGWNIKVYHTSVQDKNPIFRIERGRYGASRLSRYRGDAGAQLFAEWITWKASIVQVLKNVPRGKYKIMAYGRAWVREDEVFEKEIDHPEVDAGWGFIINGQRSIMLKQPGWNQLGYTFEHGGGDLTVELYGEVNKFPYNKTAIMFDDVVLFAENKNSVPASVHITTNLRLRGGPGPNYPILTVLVADPQNKTRLPVLQVSADGNWYRVTSNGWIHKNYTLEAI